jgi:hypothetical protein
VFGVGLWTLVFGNLVILAGIVVLLRWMLRQIASALAADVACLVFILLFAFAQFVAVGNYNYICPYTHQVTHGLVLSLAALALAWQFPRWKLRALAASGFALGPVFLTKAEIFLGASLGVLAAVALMLRAIRAAPKTWLAAIATLLGCAAVPPIIAFLIFCRSMPAEQAFAGTMGSWTVLANRDVANQPFFQHVIGTDDIASNLKWLLVTCVWYALALGASAIAAIVAGRWKGRRRAISAMAFTLAALVLYWQATAIDWDDVFRPLPVAMILFAAAIRVFRRRELVADDASATKMIKQLSFIALALGLLAKIVLYSKISHYGFVLAMPATMVLIVALLDWAPRAIDRAGGAGLVFSAAILGFLCVIIYVHLSFENELLQAKKHRVGHGVDMFWADGRGEHVNEALKQLEAGAQPNDSMTVMPEGIMLNYLARRLSPTPYVNYMPTEFRLFGEQKILSALEANPPDWIALIEKDTSEYGSRYFGLDFGQLIGQWIASHYAPASLIGSPPFVDGRFGILLMKKK